MRSLKVKIWRGGQHGAFVAYEVPRLASQSVLDVVTYVQRSIDPSLSYRFSCRVGMCGSCAMSVNGVARWTCRTHVAKVTDEASDDVLELAPLSNLPIIKDLTTDMSKNSDMSVVRSLMIGRFERGASSKTSSLASSVTLATCVRHVHRATPLTDIAHEPHMPTRQEKR